MLKCFRDHEVFWFATALTSIGCVAATITMFELDIIEWHYLVPFTALYTFIGLVWTLRLFWYDITGPRGYTDKKLFCEEDGLFIYAAGLLFGTIGWPCFLGYGITTKINSVKPLKIAERIEEKKKNLQNSEMSPTDKER